MPFGIMEASGAVPEQTKIGLDYVLVNQFDTARKAREININVSADRIVVSTVGSYEIEYFAKFSGTLNTKYTLTLFVNNVEEPQSVSSGTYDGREITFEGKLFMDLKPGAVIEMRVLSNRADGAAFKMSAGNLIVNKVAVI